MNTHHLTKTLGISIYRINRHPTFVQSIKKQYFVKKASFKRNIIAWGVVATDLERFGNKIFHTTLVGVPSPQ